MRRQLVDCVWQFAREPRQQLILREAGLLLQRGEHVRADRLLQLVRAQRLVGARSDPRVGGLAMAGLLEAVDQVTEAAAQHAARGGAADAATSTADWVTSAPTDLTEAVSETIRARPIATVAGALFVGYLLGRLAS